MLVTLLNCKCLYFMNLICVIIVKAEVFFAFHLSIFNRVLLSLIFDHCDAIFVNS